jgi:acetyltransferase-like isoleucine patch superfamily enzyme
VKFWRCTFVGEIVLHNNVQINKSQLSGNVELNASVCVDNSILAENVKISDRSKISNTEIQGDVSIENDCTIYKSFLFGNIQIGANANIKSTYLKGNILISEHFRIFDNDVKISGNIEIGRHVSINGPNTDLISVINKIQLGSFCSIARNVSIQEYNHKTTRVSTFNIQSNLFNESRLNDIDSKGGIIIENDVWIGTQCVVLSGAHISTGAIIAANSVVTGYIPPYAIAGGSPAKVLKYRFENDVIAKLLALKWWEWDDAKLNRNKYFLSSEIVDFDLVVD